MPFLVGGKSLVRLKVWGTMGAFFSCAAALSFGHWTGSVEYGLLAVCVVSPILVYTVRCERCRKAEVVYRLSGASKSFGDLLAPPKRCPNCGLERI